MNNVSDHLEGREGDKSTINDHNSFNSRAVASHSTCHCGKGDCKSSTDSHPQNSGFCSWSLVEKEVSARLKDRGQRTILKRDGFKSAIRDGVALHQTEKGHRIHLIRN